MRNDSNEKNRNGKMIDVHERDERHAFEGENENYLVKLKRGNHKE